MYHPNTDQYRSKDVSTLLKDAYRVANMSKNSEQHWGGYPLPKDYIDRMEELSVTYGHLQWLPLDLPKIDIGDTNEFLELWDRFHYDVLRVKPDVAEPWSKEEHPWGQKSSWNTAQFKGLHLYHSDLVDINASSFAAKLYPGKIPVFEKIVEQVFEYFPLYPFISIFIWESTMPIAPHKDKGAYWKCPTEFRSMLYDENTEPTLYVAEDGKDDPTFIDLPNDTSSFCWSNGKMLHGSTYYGKRKLLLCMVGPQHSQKSADLFDRSISKYKDILNYDLQQTATN